jgi:hypothetical protein
VNGADAEDGGVRIGNRRVLVTDQARASADAADVYDPSDARPTTFRGAGAARVRACNAHLLNSHGWWLLAGSIGGALTTTVVVQRATRTWHARRKT